MAFLIQRRVLVALNYGYFRRKKRQTKLQQHHYLQRTTIIHHQNIKGGKVRALAFHNFVKAKLFPLGSWLESAAGGSSGVFTQRECGSFENIKQSATKTKCHLAFGFRAGGSKSLSVSLSLSPSLSSLSLSLSQTDTHTLDMDARFSCLDPLWCPPASVDNLLRSNS